MGGCEGHRGSAGGTCALRRLCGGHCRLSCPSVRSASTGAAPEVGLMVVAPVVVAMQPCNICCAIWWALQWCAPCTMFAEARRGCPPMRGQDTHIPEVSAAGCCKQASWLSLHASSAGHRMLILLIWPPCSVWLEQGCHTRVELCFKGAPVLAAAGGASSSKGTGAD